MFQIVSGHRWAIWTGSLLAAFALLGCKSGDSSGSADTPGTTIEGIEIFQVIPSQAPPGASVQISGNGFGSNPNLMKAFFEPGIEAVVGNVTSTAMTAVVPQGAKTGPLVIQKVVLNGIAPVAVFPEFKVILDPKIQSFTPLTGPPGISVTLSGFNFSLAPQQNLVTFGGTPAQVLSATASSLVVSVPAGASTGPISVQVGAFSSTSQLSFTVITDPLIDSFSPLFGDVGTEVTIQGHNFAPAIAQNEVKFAGVLANVVAASANEVRAIVPALAKSGTITVTDTGKGASVTSLNSFYLPPSITDFDPKSGKPGETITLFGKNLSLLAANNVISVNGVESTVSSVISDTQLQFQIGAGTTSGKIDLIVKTPAGSFATQSADELSVRTERFMFTLNQGDDTVSVFSIDTVNGTGKLAYQGVEFAGEMGVAAGGIVDFAIARDEFLYALSKNSKEFYGFDIDASSGALHKLATSVSVANGPVDLVLHPTLGRAYVLGIDAGSGILSQIHLDFQNDGAIGIDYPDINLGQGVKAMALNPEGTFLYVTKASASLTTNIAIYAVDPVDGHLTATNLPTPAGFYGLIAIHPAGHTLYVYDSLSDDIVSMAIDPVAGTLQKVGASVDATLTIQALIPHPSGTAVFAPDGSGNLITLYTTLPDGSLNPPKQTAAKFVPNFPTTMFPVHVAFDSSGTFAYATMRDSGGVEQWRYNPDDQTLTWVSHIRSRLSPIRSVFFAGEVPPVSSPQTESFLYVVNKGSSSVSQYNIDAFGVQNPLAPDSIATGLTPTAIEPDLQGNYVFVTNEGSADNLRVFSLGADGVLTATGNTYTAGVNPIAMAMHPNGKWLFVSSSDPANDPGATPPIQNTLYSSFQINGDGTLTSWKSLVLPSVNGSAAVKMTVAPSGDYLYALSNISGGVKFRSIRIRAAEDTDPALGDLEFSQESIALTGSTAAGALGTMSKIHPATGYYVFCGRPAGGTAQPAKDDTTIFTFRTNSDGSFSQVDNNINNTAVNNLAGADNSWEIIQSMEMDPSGSFLYFTNSLSKTIAGVRINEVQIVSASNNPPFPTETNPLFLAKLEDLVLAPSATSTKTLFGPPFGIGLDWKNGYVHVTFPTELGSSFDAVVSYKVDTNSGELSGTVTNPSVPQVSPKAVLILEKEQ